MTSYTDDPNHEVNRYPWQRRGTKVRNALEQFLHIALDQAGNAPHVKKTCGLCRVCGHYGYDCTGTLSQDDPRAIITWLQELLDRTPQQLYPSKSARTKGSNTQS